MSSSNSTNTDNVMGMQRNREEKQKKEEGKIDLKRCKYSIYK